MRTNIEIDDGLIADVMAVLDVRTKREAVEVALRTTLLMRRQADAIRSLKGKVAFEDNANTRHAA